MSDSIPLANWNGQEMPLDKVVVSAMDRAFLFGDAVYEVVRVYQGKPWLMDEHFLRLKQSLAGIAISCDLDRLRSRALATLEHSRVQSALLYLEVTRGSALRNHVFPRPPAPPNELAYVQEVPEDKYGDIRRNGAKVVTCEDARWKRCSIKSVNLLPNCLALEAAAKAGAEEALLIGDGGFITEGAHTNVFAVQGRTLRTASLSENILPGITRGWVVKHAQEAGLAVDERSIHISEVSHVSEMFLAGTSVEVLGISAVDDRPIGRGKPGKYTVLLEKLYRRAIDAFCRGAEEETFPPAGKREAA